MISPAWLALNAATAWIGPARFHRLLKAFGAPEAVLGRSAEKLSAAVAGFSPDQAAALLKFCAAFDAAAESEALAAADIRVLRYDESAYPESLKALACPPPLLYVRGELPPPDALCVAMVGTRKPTEYGLRMAKEIAADLARAGVWVVSGLALGIDTAAHEACLDAGGKTLAVQGRGLSGIYPAANRGLGERIGFGGGALLSQFSLQAPPQRHHFPMRNALISGLCKGVLVVEGERDSGSLITADRALDQNREVFALPGPADAPASQGPLDLLENGARLVRHADDILKELGRKVPPRGRRSRTVDPAVQAELPGIQNGPELALEPDSAEAKVLAALRGLGSAKLDQVGATLGLAPADLAVAVTQLELLGALRQKPGATLEWVRG